MHHIFISIPWNSWWQMKQFQCQIHFNSMNFRYGNFSYQKVEHHIEKFQENFSYLLLAHFKRLTKKKILWEIYAIFLIVKKDFSKEFLKKLFKEMKIDSIPDDPKRRNCNLIFNVTLISFLSYMEKESIESRNLIHALIHEKCSAWFHYKNWNLFLSLGHPSMIYFRSRRLFSVDKTLSHRLLARSKKL